MFISLYNPFIREPACFLFHRVRKLKSFQIRIIKLKSLTDKHIKKRFGILKQVAGKADAVLYGWPLEDEKAVKDYSILYHVIRAAASLRSKPRRILLSAQCGTDTDISYAESWIGLERSLKLILPETDTAAVYFGQKDR